MGLHVSTGSISLETAFRYRPVSGKVKTTDARLLILGPVALDFQNAATIQARQQVLVSSGTTAQSHPKAEVYFFFFQSLYDKQLWIQVSKISHYLVNWRRFAKSISILMLSADSANLACFPHTVQKVIASFFIHSRCFSCVQDSAMDSEYSWVWCGL